MLFVLAHSMLQNDQTQSSVHSSLDRMNIVATPREKLLSLNNKLFNKSCFPEIIKRHFICWNDFSFFI